MYINRDDINLAEGVHFVQDLIGLEVKDAGNGRVYGKFPMFCVQAQTMFTKSKTPTARHTLLP